MVGGVGQAAEHDPALRSLDLEELGRLTPPLFRLLAQQSQSLLRKISVVAKEVEPRLFLRQRGAAGIDAEHVFHPGVLADALMHHVLVRRSDPRRRTEFHVFVGEHRPHRKRFQTFGVVGVDEKVERVHIRPRASGVRRQVPRGDLTPGA